MTLYSTYIEAQAAEERNKINCKTIFLDTETQHNGEEKFIVTFFHHDVQHNIAAAQYLFDDKQDNIEKLLEGVGQFICFSPSAFVKAMHQAHKHRSLIYKPSSLISEQNPLQNMHASGLLNASISTQMYLSTCIPRSVYNGVIHPSLKIQDKFNNSTYVNHLIDLLHKHNQAMKSWNTELDNKYNQVIQEQQSELQAFLIAQNASQTDQTQALSQQMNILNQHKYWQTYCNFQAMDGMTALSVVNKIFKIAAKSAVIKNITFDPSFKIYSGSVFGSLLLFMFTIPNIADISIKDLNSELIKNLALTVHLSKSYIPWYQILLQRLTSSLTNIEQNNNQGYSFSIAVILGDLLADHVLANMNMGSPKATPIEERFMMQIYNFRRFSVTLAIGLAIYLTISRMLASSLEEILNQASDPTTISNAAASYKAIVQNTKNLGLVTSTMSASMGAIIEISNYQLSPHIATKVQPWTIDNMHHLSGSGNSILAAFINDWILINMCYGSQTNIEDYKKIQSLLISTMWLQNDGFGFTVHKAYPGIKDLKLMILDEYKKYYCIQVNGSIIPYLENQPVIDWASKQTALTANPLASVVIEGTAILSTIASCTIDFIGDALGATVTHLTPSAHSYNLLVK